MRRYVLPIILVAAAIGLFALWTNGAYQEVKKLEAQVASYDDALNKAQELRKVRDDLISKRNTFKVEDIQKLQRMLPDNVDNIRLIIDINNIAARHGLSLQNVLLGEVARSRSSAAAAAVGETVGSVEIGFSVSATYDDFLIFLEDLEHSLRVVDVSDMSFNAPDVSGGRTTHELTIKTYWLH